MAKLDLVKQYKSYYSAKPSPELFYIEPVQYLSIWGQGDPGDSFFAQRIKVLYSVVYPLKFKYKAQDKDFVVAKLEGLWWFDPEKYQHITMEEAPVKVPRQEWQYRLLIRMPDFVTETMVNSTIQEVIEKKELPEAADVQLYRLTEGKVIQMLHVGPFSNEIESLKKIQSFSQDHNLQKNGLHHEIYLSDFRKVAPEKLRTILREPVK